MRSEKFTVNEKGLLLRQKPFIKWRIPAAAVYKRMPGQDEVRIMENGESYLECESSRVFMILMLVAGFYGAYTYSVRGGVFCNAQTANFVLFAMAMGRGEITRGIYYFIPMSAYLLGAIVSEILPKPVKSTHIMRWDTLLVLIEIVAVILLGFLPESAPHQISQVAINFICSMQYNTFRQAEGVPMSTTFCTNHLRQTGIALAKVLTGKEGKNAKRAWEHIKMICIFVLGGILSAFLCVLFGVRAIWGALIPLVILFIDLMYADLKTEHEYIEATPHGH